MNKRNVKELIETIIQEDGLVETGLSGVKLFRVTSPIPCAPVVYEPCIIAIVSGAKEAVLDGAKYIYDSDHYLCCPMSMPVEAGTPATSHDNPLLGVYISMDTDVMADLAIAMDNAEGIIRNRSAAPSQGVGLARWDDAFSGALLRLLQLVGDRTDIAMLGDIRMRELYYAILKGESGYFARHAFGIGNAIAQSIAHVSSHLDEPISIANMAMRAGMSRAAFHRKFKQETTMSPIQFVKSMRLNSAAMKIARGTTVNKAAMDVGYISTSQFSREFKRLYGKSPRQWVNAQGPAMSMV